MTPHGEELSCRIRLVKLNAAPCDRVECFALDMSEAR